MFVDNEAARGALIKGSTSSAASAGLVGEFWDVVARLGAHVWVERVASHSNPADAPSRNSLSWLQERGFEIDQAKALQRFEDGEKKLQA